MEIANENCIQLYTIIPKIPVKNNENSYYICIKKKEWSKISLVFEIYYFKYFNPFLCPFNPIVNGYIPELCLNVNIKDTYVVWVPTNKLLVRESTKRKYHGLKSYIFFDPLE